MKEREHPGRSKYMAYGLMLNCYRNVGYKTRFGGGLEISYNNAERSQLAEDSTMTAVGFGDVIHAGAKAGYVFQLDRLSFPVEFGVYLRNNKAQNDLFFHRIGLRYLVNKHFVANLSLLTHWARADYFEFVAGYEF